MTVVLIVALCLASALAGRLLITRDQALKTLTVRLPAVGLLIVGAFICLFTWVVVAVVCFIGGSFYGLITWWVPTLNPLFEGIQYPLNAIIFGRWDDGK